MSWLLVVPGYQQPWYWLRNVNILIFLGSELEQPAKFQWQGLQIYFDYLSPQKNSAWEGLLPSCFSFLHPCLQVSCLWPSSVSSQLSSRPSQWPPVPVVLPPLLAPCTLAWWPRPRPLARDFRRRPWPPWVATFRRSLSRPWWHWPTKVYTTTAGSHSTVPSHHNMLTPCHLATIQHKDDILPV